MSGTNYESRCPVCGSQMNMYSDWKPYDFVDGDCINCGFLLFTTAEQQTLTELNRRRKELNKDEGYKPKDKEYLKPITQKQFNEYKRVFERL